MTLEKHTTRGPVGSVEKEEFGETLSVTLKNGFNFTFRYVDDVVDIDTHPGGAKEKNPDQLGTHHTIASLNARPLSYSYFVTFDETYVLVKVHTSGNKNQCYEVSIPDITWSRPRNEEFYETEKWWRQLIFETYPEGYNKLGRPLNWKAPVVRDEYHKEYYVVVTDMHGSRTSVDREAFVLCFPECHIYSRETRIWYPHAVIRNLSWYLDGHETFYKDEGLRSYGDLILLSESYKSPYLKHWCIRTILSTMWYAISPAEASWLHENLCKSESEEMKELEPLLSKLAQRKKATMKEGRYYY